MLQMYIMCGAAIPSQRGWSTIWEKLGVEALNGHLIVINLQSEGY